MKSLNRNRKIRNLRIVAVAAAGAMGLIVISRAPATVTFSENFDEPGGFFAGGINNVPSDPPGDWQVVNNSQPVGRNGWFDGPPGFRSSFTAQSGSTFAAVDQASGSNVATLSNWLLTPQITFNAGDQVSFYARTISSPSFADRLQLYLSSSGASANVGSTSTSTGGFSTLLVDINPTYKVSGAGSFPNSWTQFTVVLPASGSGRLGFRYFVENGGPGGANSDFIGLDTLSVIGASSNQWAQNTGGSWGDAINWSSGVPGGMGVKVGFLSSPTGLTSAGIINLNGDRTVGQITFDNTNGYTIASGSGGTLTIDDSTDSGGVSPSITVNSGNHSISAAVSLSNGVAISSAASSSLTIAAGVSGSGTLTASGAGTLMIASGALLNVPLMVNGNVNFASNSATGILTRNVPSIGLGSSGKLSIADPLAAVHANRSVLVTSALTFSGSMNSWQGTLDLGGNDLIVRNGDLTNIPNQLKAGFNAHVGYWNGAGGIVSTAAAGDTRHLTTLGYRTGGSPFDGANTTSADVLVKYTYYGDADLNGAVNGADYHQIDLGFGSAHAPTPLTGWSNGDFNYDGVVDGTDYALTDNAFNQLAATGLGPLAVVAGPANLIAVPEPLGLGLVAIALLGAVRRRRKSAMR